MKIGGEGTVKCLHSIISRLSNFKACELCILHKALHYWRKLCFYAIPTCV